MGIAPGPIYRQLLDELLDARIDREVENRFDEFHFLVLRHPELFPAGVSEAEWKSFC
jgi:hypothetical protein